MVGWPMQDKGEHLLDWLLFHGVPLLHRDWHSNQEQQ